MPFVASIIHFVVAWPFSAIKPYFRHRHVYRHYIYFSWRIDMSLSLHLSPIAWYLFLISHAAMSEETTVILSYWVKTSISTLRHRQEMHFIFIIKRGESLWLKLKHYHITTTALFHIAKYWLLACFKNLKPRLYFSDCHRYIKAPHNLNKIYCILHLQIRKSGAIQHSALCNVERDIF